MKKHITIRVKKNILKKAIAMLITVAILATNSIAIVLAEGINASSSYSNMHNDWSTNRWVGWKYATSGGIVSSVQAICGASGFNPGSIDGYYGTNTQNAIIGFQNREGLMRDGAVGTSTWGQFQKYRRYDGGRMETSTWAKEYYHYYDFGSTINFSRALEYSNNAWIEHLWWLILPDGTMISV